MADLWIRSRIQVSEIWDYPLWRVPETRLGRYIKLTLLRKNGVAVDEGPQHSLRASLTVGTLRAGPVKAIRDMRQNGIAGVGCGCEFGIAMVAVSG